MSTEPALRLAPSHALSPLSSAGLPPNAMPAPPVLDSTLLLQGRQEVMIAHQGQHYRLRVTALGKLILTK